MAKIQFEALLHGYTSTALPQAVSNNLSDSFVKVGHFLSLGHVINRHSNWREKMDASLLSVASTPGPPESRRGRKRLRNEKNWKRKKRKLHKDNGKSYTTFKGVQKPAKELVSITCRCSNKCRENISDEERERILMGFYGLGSHDQQNKYLFGLIHKVDVKRRHGTGGHAGRRHTFTYRIRLRDSKSIQVCKNTFCVLHGVGKRRVEGVAAQLVDGAVIASDQRGKHKSRPHSISDQVKEKIREHIKAVWMNFGQGRDITGEVTKHPDEVWLRYSYSEDEPWSKVSLHKGRKKLPPSRVFFCLRNI